MGWTLVDPLAGSDIIWTCLGWGNQKNGYKPEDVVPSINLGLGLYLTWMMSPATNWIGWLKRYGVQEASGYVLRIFLLPADKRGGRGGGTAVLGIYGPSREFQAPI